MRTKILTAVAALSAAAVAVPAAAQWAPQPNYGYGQGYGQGLNNYGQIRALEARVVQAQREIDRLDRRNVLSNREARQLRNNAQDIRSDLRRASRDGVNYREFARFERRVSDLQLRIQREARDGNRYGDNRSWSDRDRDGRNDRYEDDRGYRHD